MTLLFQLFVEMVLGLLVLLALVVSCAVLAGTGWSRRHRR